MLRMIYLLRRLPICQSRTGPCGRRHHGGRFLNTYGTMAARINSGMQHAGSVGRILMLPMMIDCGFARTSTPLVSLSYIIAACLYMEPNDRASTQVLASFARMLLFLVNV